VCTGYIEVFRSIPTLLLVYVFLFALPGVGLNLSIFWKLTVPIILINAAVIAEIVRAGIRALDRGQSEAALAIGMTGAAAMRHVVLPQAVKLVVPSLVTQLVALLKDSTLGYVVSYPELMKQANTLANNTKLLLQSFVIVSLIYIVINFALTRLATWLEQRLRQRPGSRPLRRGTGRPASPGTGTTGDVHAELPTAVAPR
jgi:glutamate transport system permease protein